MKKNILKIILLVVIDQIIKLIVFNTIGTSGNNIILVPHLLSLSYVENVGAAFGMVGSRIFLIALDLLIIVFIIKLILNKKYEFEKNAKLGMCLILSGGIGNLIDRLFRGYVIDYIDITELFDFPVFNFADICIVLGVILVMAVIIINTVKNQENAEKT